MCTIGHPINIFPSFYFRDLSTKQYSLSACMHACSQVSFWHKEPVNPGAQVHMNDPAWNWQVPPFSHGLVGQLTMTEERNQGVHM